MHASLFSPLGLVLTLKTPMNKLFTLVGEEYKEEKDLSPPSNCTFLYVFYTCLANTLQIGLKTLGTVRGT